MSLASSRRSSRSSSGRKSREFGSAEIFSRQSSNSANESSGSEFGLFRGRSGSDSAEASGGGSRQSTYLPVLHADLLKFKSSKENVADNQLQPADQHVGMIQSMLNSAMPLQLAQSRAGSSTGMVSVNSFPTSASPVVRPVRTPTGNLLFPTISTARPPIVIGETAHVNRIQRGNHTYVAAENALAEGTKRLWKSDRDVWLLKDWELALSRVNGQQQKGRGRRRDGTRSADLLSRGEPVGLTTHTSARRKSLNVSPAYPDEGHSGASHHTTMAPGSPGMSPQRASILSRPPSALPRLSLTSRPPSGALRPSVGLRPPSGQSRLSTASRPSTAARPSSGRTSVVSPLRTITPSNLLRDENNEDAEDVVSRPYSAPQGVPSFSTVHGAHMSMVGNSVPIELGAAQPGSPRVMFRSTLVVTRGGGSPAPRLSTAPPATPNTWHEGSQPNVKRHDGAQPEIARQPSAQTVVNHGPGSLANALTDTTVPSDSFAFKTDHDMQFDLQEAANFMRVLQKESRVRFVSLENDPHHIATEGAPSNNASREGSRRSRRKESETVQVTLLEPDVPQIIPPPAPSKPPTVVAYPTASSVPKLPHTLLDSDDENDESEIALQGEILPVNDGKPLEEPEQLEIQQHEPQIEMIPVWEPVEISLPSGPDPVDEIIDERAPNTPPPEFPPGFFYDPSPDHTSPSSLVPDTSRPDTAGTFQLQRSADLTPEPELAELVAPVAPISKVKVRKVKVHKVEVPLGPLPIKNNWNLRERDFARAHGGIAVGALSNYVYGLQYQRGLAERHTQSALINTQVRVHQQLGRLMLNERRQAVSRGTDVGCLWSAPGTGGAACRCEVSGCKKNRVHSCRNQIRSRSGRIRSARSRGSADRRKSGGGTGKVGPEPVIIGR
ncbi:hypothetical protein DFS34DRAFT_195864 [Phlyctochytrium arcticum]|nr:hypothetical protein DFS34DRAFT_195864 [Phlyctochytrium arcticum]